MNSDVRRELRSEQTVSWPEPPAPAAFHGPTAAVSTVAPQAEPRVLTPAGQGGIVRKGRPRVIIWRDWISDSRELTATQKLVALTLAGKAMNADGYPSRAAPAALLAVKCSLSRRAVEGALRGLVDRGWV